MTTMSRLAGLMVMGTLAVGLGGCMHVEDPLAQYTQRTGKITMSAGNSSQANLAIHTLDPWPRLSANRRVPANGQRMADAYERYRDAMKASPRPTINPVQATGAAATGGAGAGAPAPR